MIQNATNSASFGVDIPFIDHLGFEIISMHDGASEMRYEARPEHLNSFGVTHGGASMTLLDVAMALAARSVRPDSGVVTIEMKTSFMHAARGPMVAKARLLQGTATLAFTEATVYDANGQACTHATGTFKYLRRLPVSASRAQALRSIDPK